jgi:hypothetical protein
MFKGLGQPLWSSVGKMGANIKWMLDNGYSEATVLASFEVFQGQIHAVAWRGQAVWDEYYKRKVKLLQQTATASIGGDGSAESGVDALVRHAQERRQRAAQDH